MQQAAFDTRGLIDLEHARQAKRLYWDRDIYELEQEKIFGRCWLFLAQDNLIPNVGDYVVTTMGEDEVLVVRQRDKSVRAFLNHCMHRGARVVVAEAGNARGFVCNYHGWGYSLEGKLDVLPLEKEAYGRFDKSTHGLREIRVENYHGFYYGNFDKDAPSFREYLGDMAWYYDIWFEATGGLELIGPPARTRLQTNWKITAENFAGDVYHAPWAHSNYFAANTAEHFGEAGEQKPPEGIQVTAAYGHGAGILKHIGASSLQARVGPLLQAWYDQRKPGIVKALGDLRGDYYAAHVNTTTFPNNSFLFGSSQFKVWHPRGPNEIELWTWPFLEKAMPQELKDVMVPAILRAYAAAGTVEIEDADVLETAVSLNVGRQTRHGWMNAQLGLGSDCELPGHPGVVSPVPMSEVCHRGFYRAYKDYLECRDWAELKDRSTTWKQQLIGR